MDLYRLRSSTRWDLVKHVVTGWDHLFGPWLAERTDGDWFPGKGSTIGLFDDVRGIVGAALFTASNGASILLHCAGSDKHWLNREFLWFVFYYPFVQLGLTKIISPVEQGNENCIRFIENIGFTLEATLQSASPKGNLLLYTLARENCKWHLMRKNPGGKTFSS